MDTETTEPETTETPTATKKPPGKQADGARRSYFMFDPDEIVIVGVDTKDGPEHPLYDERIKLPLDEGMVRNIQTYGVITPIAFVRDGETVLTVDGRRRVLHAREAKKRQLAAGEEPVKVPALPKRGEDAYLFGISRASNAMRVNDGPLTNARNAQRMLDMGSSEAEIAVAFGVKVSTVKDWLTLLDLATPVKNAVAKGTLSASAASGLAKLSKEEQAAHLEELLAKGVKATADNVINKVREGKGKAPINTPKVRVEKAEAILTKVAKSWNDMTKDELIEVVDKLSKALLSKGMAKLVAEIEKAEAE
jgi:ParB family chromosome partitioning protein